MRRPSEAQARALDALSRRVHRGPAQRARRAVAQRPEKPVKRVTKAALDALRRVERELAKATPKTSPGTILAVVRELRGVDPLSVEVGRAGTIERLTALGVPDAESAVDAAFAHYGLTAPLDSAAAARGAMRDGD